MLVFVVLISQNDFMLTVFWGGQKKHQYSCQWFLRKNKLILSLNSNSWSIDFVVKGEETHAYELLPDTPWSFNEETSCCQSWKDLNFNRIRSWPRILNMERGPLNYHKHYSKLKTSPYKLNVFFLINEQAFYTADVLTYSVMVLVNPASLHNIRSATPNWWTVINFTNLHLYFFTYTGVCVYTIYTVYTNDQCLCP